MKKFSILLAMAVAVCFVFAGCSKTKEEAGEMKDNVEEKVTDMGTQAKNFFTDIRDDINNNAKKIEENLKLGGKATLEAIDEEADTLKYRFTVAGEELSMETKEMEAKAEELADEARTRLQQMKDKGVENAKVVVQFVDREGKELYSRVFK